jgi:hypothetical protein
MVDNPASVDERLAKLGSAIAAARAQLAQRADFEDDEVGDVLESVNRDLDAVSHDNAAEAHAAYDRIEARLAELQPFLAVLPR